MTLKEFAENFDGGLIEVRSKDNSQFLMSSETIPLVFSEDFLNSEVKSFEDSKVYTDFDVYDILARKGKGIE